MEKQLYKRDIQGRKYKYGVHQLGRALHQPTRLYALHIESL